MEPVAELGELAAPAKPRENHYFKEGLGALKTHAGVQAPIGANTTNLLNMLARAAATSMGNRLTSMAIHSARKTMAADEVLAVLQGFGGQWAKKCFQAVEQALQAYDGFMAQREADRAAKPEGAKTAPVRTETKAGLILPVSVVEKFFVLMTNRLVSTRATVAVTAAVEYVVRTLMVAAATELKGAHVLPRHLRFAVERSPQLKEMLWELGIKLAVGGAIPRPLDPRLIDQQRAKALRVVELVQNTNKLQIAHAKVDAIARHLARGPDGKDARFKGNMLMIVQTLVEQEIFDILQYALQLSLQSGGVTLLRESIVTAVHAAGYRNFELSDADDADAKSVAESYIDEAAKNADDDLGDATGVDIDDALGVSTADEMTKNVAGANGSAHGNAHDDDDAAPAPIPEADGEMPKLPVKVDLRQLKLPLMAVRRFCRGAGSVRDRASVIPAVNDLFYFLMQTCLRAARVGAAARGHLTLQPSDLVDGWYTLRGQALVYPGADAWLDHES